jgi:hypothetical protein
MSSTCTNLTERYEEEKQYFKVIKPVGHTLRQPVHFISADEQKQMENGHKYFK